MAEVHSRRTARIARRPDRGRGHERALDDEVRIALGQRPVPERGRIGAHEVGHDDLSLAGAERAARHLVGHPVPGATPSPEASGEDLGDHLVRRALGDGSVRPMYPPVLRYAGERGRIQLADSSAVAAARREGSGSAERG